MLRNKIGPVFNTVLGLFVFLWKFLFFLQGEQDFKNRKQKIPDFNTKKGKTWTSFQLYSKKKICIYIYIYIHIFFNTHTHIYIYIYACYRLQKRGPIFGFIGSKTGPKFEVEMGNYNNKKTIYPPVLGCKCTSHEVRFWPLRAHRSWLQ